MGFLKSKAVVLKYSNISYDKENFLDEWVYHKSFEEQLDYLSKNNIPIIPLDDAVAYMKGSLKLKRPSFSLTFDTGFIELFTICYPLLKRYGFPATFFIRPDTVGRTAKLNGRDVQYMNWDHIHELAENGMTIGLFGCRGRMVSNTPLEEIEGEIREFKSAFEKKLGKKIVYYSVNDDVPKEPMISLLKREGFQAAFCQAPTEQKAHLYTVGRILIDDNDLNILLIKISRTYIFFKDSRYWTYFRQYKLDKAVHLLSNTLNRLKGKEIY